MPATSPAAGPSATRTRPVRRTQVDLVDEHRTALCEDGVVIGPPRNRAGALPLFLDLALERRDRSDACGDSPAYDVLVVKPFDAGQAELQRATPSVAKAEPECDPWHRALVGAEDRRHFVGSIRRRFCLLDIALHAAVQHRVCGERRDRAGKAPDRQCGAREPRLGRITDDRIDPAKGDGEPRGSNAKMAPVTHSLR